MKPVKYLEDLMRIESHESVNEIRSFLLDTVTGAQVDEETGCVFAEKGADDNGPQVVLNTHMDVVSPHIAFERDGDVIRGRGACDAKGSLAAMVSAFSRTNPAAGSISLLVSPDEETTQRGLKEYLSGGVDADMAIVGEPTGLDLCPAARGHYDFEITFRGQSAHGATPASGLNATSCAAEAIRRIEAINHLHDELLGTNSQTPTIVRGGNRPNQVPEHASLVVDYRTLPAETRDDAVDTLKRALDGIECEFEIDRYEGGSALESFRTDEDAEVVETLGEIARKVSGRTPSIRPFDAATEAAFFAPYVPVVVFGPGLISDGDQPIAHSEREHVPVSDVEEAADILTRTLRTLLR